MRRPATLALLALAAGAGAALFTVSYDVSELEDRLATLNRQIVEDQDAIHVLRAEWSFLNQPARLEELSQRYLDLQPLEGSQMGDAAMLPVRLTNPAPVDTPLPPRLETEYATASAAPTGPQPTLKPFPPARAPTHLESRPAANHKWTSPPPKPLPVVARSLNDVLADLTQHHGNRR